MTDAKTIHETLKRHQLADGYPFVMDLDKSHGSWLHDSVTGGELLDFFTCFASWPIGYNHPSMSDPAFEEELLRAARHNPANSDLYTAEMTAFVDAFGSKLTPPEFPHHFWISGGALAVENAMKTAFDWKAQKLGSDACNDGNDLVILHFKAAFHGRSGYTMSVTNTDPTKVELFPKFDWPRIHNPAIEFDLNGNIANDIEAEEARACAEIDAAFDKWGDKIAGILIETMQGEGGDCHFRTEFFQSLRKYADDRDCLLLYDEVQTGFYGSGKAWMWEHHGVAPDVVAFGKKTQVCGIYASNRVDEVEENVFVKSSRINSTWGGSLTDMVRSRKLIEIVQGENLGENVAARGTELVDGLRSLARDRGHLSNVRGIGSLVAFTLDSAEIRNDMIAALYKKGILVLASGERAIRFRMPLNVTSEEVQTALERVAGCMPQKVQI
jgi:L-lysine 6-transaminase